ncbi:beta strand repeat-containing protein [Brevundimonas sp. Root1279]|uniref:beta strand repeat-containing protein n=1 Tax=Brevundimonas sp. Root1279 TaxID=1736443 RepID=UPI0006F880F8|nr:Ig-like domain-containing protein [Brevundimonas sp. Root1279]KQW79799.1 hypothetical protein ASC65_14735 [Brevundimonas sp. Root1279]
MPFTTPFVVSPFNAGDNEVRPAVTRLPNGQLVVIYEHYDALGNNSFGIRVINPDGTPVTNEIFEVIGGYGAMPRVTAIDATHFAVVVADYATPTGAVEMIAQVYTITGASISHGGDLPISNPASLDDDNGNDHQILRLPDGNFLVVWAQYTGNYSGAQLVARTFDANFNPLTPETRISEFANTGVSNPLLTLNGFDAVVSWTQNNPLDGGNVHARVASFTVGAATGALPVSPPNELDLGAHTTIRSLTYLANGDVLVVYVGGPVSGGALDDGDKLTARVYSADLSTVKATVQVNDVVDDNGVSTVSAVAFPWGGFQIIWSQDPTGGTGPSSDFELFSRAYNNTYAPDAGPVQLTSNASSDYDPVAVLDGVNVTVTWATGNASGGGTIVGLHLTHQDPDAPNIAPSGADATVTLAEDGEHVFTGADFGFADVDRDDLGGVVITTMPINGWIVIVDGDGAVVSTLVSGDAVTAAQIDAGLVRYRPATDANGAGYDTFTFQVSDDGGTANAGVDLDQSPNTITLDVTAVNDAPFVDLNGNGSETGTTATYVENGAAVLLAPNAALRDIDSANLTGATVSISAGMVALHDYLSIDGSASGVVNGVTYSYNPFTGVLTFSGSASLATYQALLQQVVFDSTSDAPGAGRTVSWTVTDGTATSAADTTIVSITGTNDAPTGSVTISGVVAEDQTLTVDASDLADADGLGTLHYQWQRDTGAGYVNVGSDQATYILGDADVGAVIRVVVYYTDAGGTVESATSAGTAAVANVDDAAVASDDADSTLESVVLTGSVVANDSDADGPPFVVAAVNGSAAAVGTQITLASGALLTLNADGTYSYDPNGAFDALSGTASGGANLTATDSFTYTLDSGSTATVTLTIVGEDSEGDEVAGDSGDNTLDAGDGDDVITGGAGNDTLIGGDGVDTADYQNAAARIVAKLNAGSVSDDGDGGADTLTGIENLTGSAFNDILIGATGGNVLSGGGGADTLIGLDGNDVLRGGVGAANQLQGGTGDDDYYVDANDTVIELVNQGHDRIFTTRDRLTLVANVEELHYTGGGNFIGTGNGLDNAISGGAGADVLYGAAGNDSLDGGAGSNDTATYASASSHIGVQASLLHGLASSDGDGGRDVLVGIENLTGSAVRDVLGGDHGANVLSGGAGDDHLEGLGGNDTLLGGVGVDTVDYGAAMTGVTVRLDLNFAQDGLGGTDTLVAVENVYGSSQDDLIVGNALDNQLTGDGGRDVLLGMGGDDTLWGGIGAANTLYGGLGDDIYIVTANDTIVELAGQGTDTVQTDRSNFTLSANLEELLYGGHGDFAGTGNASNNYIVGGDGRDTLTGGAGDDLLDGDDGRDMAVFRGIRSDYVITDIGSGRYEIVDTIGGRDGTDYTFRIETVRFADGTFVLADLVIAAPALSAKDVGAVVSPLTDDAFILPKGLELPLVVPAVGGFDSPSLVDAPVAASGADILTVDDGASRFSVFDDHRGAHHHDDWML